MFAPWFCILCTYVKYIKWLLPRPHFDSGFFVEVGVTDEANRLSWMIDDASRTSQRFISAPLSDGSWRSYNRHAWPVMAEKVFASNG